MVEKSATGRTIVTGNTLGRISADLVALFRQITREDFSEMLDMKDYHGFIKSRFPHVVLAKILKAYDLSPEDVQVELVGVRTDLSNENHLHKEAHAFTTILGEQEHVDDPRSARAFKNDSWIPVSAGDQFDFPPNTPHTFSVNSDGILYFLSVQAPPIERKAGHDDYFRISEL